MNSSRKETAVLRNREKRTDYCKKDTAIIVEAEVKLCGEKFYIEKINWLVINLWCENLVDIVKVPMMYLPCRIKETETGKRFGEVEITNKYIALLKDLGVLTDYNTIADKGDYILLEELMEEVSNFVGKPIRVITEVETTVETRVRFGSFIN